MTTLADRPQAALVVVDAQNDVVGGAHDRDRVVANIATLVDRARAAGAAVVWVQNSSDETPVDSEGWQLFPPCGAPPPTLVIAHTNLYWSDHQAPGRTAGTVQTADADFSQANPISSAPAVDAASGLPWSRTPPAAPSGLDDAILGLRERSPSSK